MRSLTYSLLLVVLVSIFGLGWALDALFSRVADTDKDYMSVVTSVGRELALAINNATSPEALLDGSKYAATLTAVDDFYLPESVQTTLKTGEPVVLESEMGLSLNYYLPNHQQVLSLENIPALDADQSGIKVLFTSVFYIGTLALVLLWLKPLLRRLGLLRKASVEFGSGNLNSRVDSQGISYIADIEKEFNRMAERIQNQVDDNKLLTSAVSHDLRTPLARLRFGVDTLAVSDQPEARAQYLTRVSRDLDEMESQIDSLLRFARLDNVMNDAANSPVDLASLAEECVAQFADESVEVKLYTDNRPASVFGASVFGSMDHLGSLLNNLIQNAVDHAESKVEVQVRSEKDSIALIVSDDGPGLNLDTVDKILKPFQRGETSTGYGLGLAIVSRVALHHRAELVPGVAETLGGACFTVRFPVSQ